MRIMVSIVLYIGSIRSHPPLVDGIFHIAFFLVGPVACSGFPCMAIPGLLLLPHHHDDEARALSCFRV